MSEPSSVASINRSINLSTYQSKAASPWFKLISFRYVQEVVLHRIGYQLCGRWTDVRLREAYITMTTIEIEVENAIDVANIVSRSRI